MALRDKAARAAYNRAYRDRVKSDPVRRERQRLLKKAINSRYRTKHPAKARLQGQILWEPSTLARKAASLRWGGISEEGERMGELMLAHERWEFAMLLAIGIERDNRGA